MAHATLAFTTTLSAPHQLILFPKAKTLPKDIAHADLLASVLKRRDMKAEELAKSPVAANAADGTLVVWAMLDDKKDTFAQQVVVRKALQLLLEEQPKVLGIAVSGATAQRAAELAVYGAWVNSALMPVHKKKDERKALQKIELCGVKPNPSQPPLVRGGAGSALPLTRGSWRGFKPLNTPNQTGCILEHAYIMMLALVRGDRPRHLFN